MTPLFASISRPISSPAACPPSPAPRAGFLRLVPPLTGAAAPPAPHARASLCTSPMTQDGSRELSLSRTQRTLPVLCSPSPNVTHVLRRVACARPATRGRAAARAPPSSPVLPGEGAAARRRSSRPWPSCAARVPPRTIAATLERKARPRAASCSGDDRAARARARLGLWPPSRRARGPSSVEKPVIARARRSPRCAARIRRRVSEISRRASGSRQAPTRAGHVVRLARPLQGTRHVRRLRICPRFERGGVLGWADAAAPAPTRGERVVDARAARGPYVRGVPRCGRLRPLEAPLRPSLRPRLLNTGCIAQIPPRPVLLA